jgi:hypothetical protein
MAHPLQLVVGDYGDVDESHKLRMKRQITNRIFNTIGCRSYNMIYHVALRCVSAYDRYEYHIRYFANELRTYTETRIAYLCKLFHVHRLFKKHGNIGVPRHPDLAKMTKAETNMGQANMRQFTFYIKKLSRKQTPAKIVHKYTILYEDIVKSINTCTRTLRNLRKMCARTAYVVRFIRDHIIIRNDSVCLDETIAMCSFGTFDQYQIPHQRALGA